MTTGQYEPRTISIPSFLVAKLEEAIAGRGPEDFVFGDGRSPLHPPHSKNGWRAQADRRARAIDRDFPHITPHALRHTSASFASAEPKNPKFVQNMLGHASAAHTLDIDAHLVPDDMDRLADGRDEAIA